MSEYDDVLCPICMVSELTAATKVYPLCLCKLSICFDCLRRWAETKYCCPFCNIPFTQIALQQTEDELRVRLRGKVETGKLEEVVSAWAELLNHLRAEMEIGLTVLSMDSLGDDDDGFYDFVWEPLQRSRTPFFPSDWGRISSTSSMFSISNTRNARFAPPSVSNNVNNMASLLIVQPSLSMSLTQPSNIPQVFPTQLSRNADNEKLPEGFSKETDAVNLELSSNVIENLRHISSSNSQPNTTNLGPCFSRKAAIFPGNKKSSPPFGNDCYVRTGDLNVPTTPNNWNRPNSLRNWRNQSAGNLSINSTSSKVEEILRKNGSQAAQVKLILSKQLKVRWVVRLRPGTLSARKYGSNALGVIMKHVKQNDFGEGFDEMTLTVRLLDGSWLTEVPEEHLSSVGRRATLTEWLRIGDLLRTRFGICMAKELNPELGQVTVQFLGRFIDPWECSSLNRHVIHEELRSVLYNSRTLSRCSHGDELKLDMRSQKEEIKGKLNPLGHIVNTPLPGNKIKLTVIPLLSNKDKDSSRRDAEEHKFFLDSDDVNLPPCIPGSTERASVPFEPHTPTEDMKGEDIILANEFTKVKHIVNPMLPKTKAGNSKRYAFEDWSPVLDNGNAKLPDQNLDITDKPSNFFQRATTQEEMIEKRMTDVRVVGLPLSGIKAKHTANAMVSRSNTDVPSETEQDELLVLEYSDLKLDSSTTTRSTRRSLLIQPATTNLGSETSAEDGIEEPFIPKSLLHTGLTNSSGSFILPGSGPFYRKAGTRQSYSDLPEFNLPPEGEEKLTVRIIYDTDIKTVVSAQDLIAPIEKRAERLEAIRTAGAAEHLSITIGI